MFSTLLRSGFVLVHQSLFCVVKSGSSAEHDGKDFQYYPRTLKSARSSRDKYVRTLRDEKIASLLLFQEGSCHVQEQCGD